MKKAGQMIGAFFIVLFGFVIVGLAGYGTYALVDKYALPKDEKPAETEKVPEGDQTVTTTIEYEIAEQSLAEYLA